MPILFNNNCTVEIYNRIGPRPMDWQRVTTYKESIAIDYGGIMNESVVVFPLMNNSLTFHVFSLFIISNKHLDAAKTVLESSADLFTKDRELMGITLKRFAVDLTCEPRFKQDDKGIELQADETNSHRKYLPHNRNNKIIISFQKQEDYITIKSIIVNIIKHHDYKEDCPFYDKYPPTCQCGSLKVLNAEYLFTLSMGEAKPFFKQFICKPCTTIYCTLENILSKVARAPDPSKNNPSEVMEMLENQLKIAILLDDPLAIANSKLSMGHYMAMLSIDKDRALNLMEESRDFLKTYKQFEEETFYNQMLEKYKDSIFFLGQMYQSLEKHDRALPLLQEGLKFDEAEGNQLNKAMSFTTIGRSLVALDRYAEAEPLLINAIEIKKKSDKTTKSSMYLSLIALIELYLKLNNKAKTREYLDELEQKYANLFPADSKSQKILDSANAFVNDQAMNKENSKSLSSPAKSTPLHSDDSKPKIISTYSRCRIKEKQGDLDGALKILSDDTAKQEADERIDLARGAILMKKGDTRGAELAWREALKKEKNCGVAFFQLHLLRIHKEMINPQFETVAEELLRELEENPYSPELWLKVMKICQDCFDNEGASLAAQLAQYYSKF